MAYLCAVNRGQWISYMIFMHMFQFNWSQSVHVSSESAWWCSEDKGWGGGWGMGDCVLYTAGGQNNKSCRTDPPLQFHIWSTKGDVWQSAWMNGLPAGGVYHHQTFRMPFGLYIFLKQAALISLPGNKQSVTWILKLPGAVWENSVALPMFAYRILFAVGN